MSIVELPASEYWAIFNSIQFNEQDIQVPSYLYPRAFYVPPDSIYINKNAFFLDATDKNLVIAHELGHSAGATHTLIGVMSPIGPVRYFTASYEGAILLAALIAVIVIMYWYHIKSNRRTTT